MNKKYPTEATFLLCDEIRKEEGDKVSVMGLYGGRNVVVSLATKNETGEPGADEVGIVLDGLSILAIFNGAEGKFDVSQRLVAPSEAVMFDKERSLVVDGYPNKAMLIGTKMRPFHIPKFGEFIFNLTLDDQEPYEFRFRVLKNQNNN